MALKVYHLHHVDQIDQVVVVTAFAAVVPVVWNSVSQFRNPDGAVRVASMGGRVRAEVLLLYGCFDGRAYRREMLVNSLKVVNLSQQNSKITI